MYVFEKCQCNPSNYYSVRTRVSQNILELLRFSYLRVYYNINVGNNILFEINVRRFSSGTALQKIFDKT